MELQRTRYQRLTGTMSRRSGNHFSGKLCGISQLSWQRICCLISPKFIPSKISHFHTSIPFIYLFIYFPLNLSHFTYSLQTGRSGWINTHHCVSSGEFCITRNMICDIKDINWLKCFPLKKHNLSPSVSLAVSVAGFRTWFKTLNRDRNGCKHR